MVCWAFVFARGGSKGLVNKNIKSLAGKPMIAYAIEAALSAPSVDRVFVSTDDDQIASIAKQYGAEVPFLRPADLATDTSSEWKAWQHAVKFVQEEYGDFNVFVSLPATSPCREVADIENCIAKLGKSVDMVITAMPANHNPYFNMLREGEGGYRLFCDSEPKFNRRQDVPQAYNILTVAYVTRPEFILSSNGIWDGELAVQFIEPLNGIDVDDINDFKMAELIMKDRLGVN